MKARTAIELEDESSELIYEELLSCGRAACRRTFCLPLFHSLSEVSCKGKLIYRENNRFRPASWPMEELGLFEGYTHMAGMLIHMQAVKRKREEGNTQSGRRGRKCSGSTVRCDQNGRRGPGGAHSWQKGGNREKNM